MIAWCTMCDTMIAWCTMYDTMIAWCTMCDTIAYYAKFDTIVRYTMCDTTMCDVIPLAKLNQPCG